MWFPAAAPAPKQSHKLSTVIGPRDEEEVMHEYLDFLIEHHTVEMGATLREMRRYETVRAILMSRFK